MSDAGHYGLPLRVSRMVLALGLAASLLVPAAMAGQPVSLRGDLSSAGVITLGDLFDNAGTVSKIFVGNGAPVGLSAVLDAGEVQRIAHAHGRDWDNPKCVRRIIV